MSLDKRGFSDTAVAYQNELEFWGTFRKSLRSLKEGGILHNREEKDVG